MNFEVRIKDKELAFANTEGCFMQYYHRRGNKLYFRNGDNKYIIEPNENEFKEVIEYLFFGERYYMKLEY